MKRTVKVTLYKLNNNSCPTYLIENSIEENVKKKIQNKTKKT